jgi:aryl-alcohol dehydrogenase-like predicted oxidoreductase
MSEPAGTDPRPARFTPTRRHVVTGAAAIGVGTWLPRGASAEPPAPAPKPMPMRAFGKTGEKVSLFGLGCFPIGGLARDDEAVEVIVRALDLGCTYLDTAPSYARGVSETRVGQALEARRDKPVFLATKTHTRTADDAWRDLEGSLKRLGVEQIDLVQVHAINDAKDLEAALDRKKGPLAALEKARAQKLIRFIGVTGHRDPVLMREAFQRYPFDSALFPLNCVDAHYVTKGPTPEPVIFERDTLPAAVEKGLARVAMKVFSAGRLVTKGIPAADCLRYTYGLDISTAIVGCETIAHVELAAKLARANTPLSAAERRGLLEKTRPHRGRKTEWYKRP